MSDELSRCQHGSALRDGAGERLEPPCGCRAESEYDRLRAVSPEDALYFSAINEEIERLDLAIEVASLANYSEINRVTLECRRKNLMDDREALSRRLRELVEDRDRLEWLMPGLRLSRELIDDARSVTRSGAIP